MLHVVAVVVEVVVVAVEATLVSRFTTKTSSVQHKANGQLGQSLRQHEDHWQTPPVAGNQGAQAFEDVQEWNAPKAVVM